MRLIIDFDNEKLIREVVAKISERNLRIIQTDGASAVSPSNGRHYFYASNTRHKDRISLSRIADLLNPIGADFGNVELCQRTAFEEERYQLYLRSSMMVSETGFPL